MVEKNVDWVFWVVQKGKTNGQREMDIIPSFEWRDDLNLITQTESESESERESERREERARERVISGESERERGWKTWRIRRRSFAKRGQRKAEERSRGGERRRRPKQTGGARDF